MAVDLKTVAKTLIDADKLDQAAEVLNAADELKHVRNLVVMAASEGFFIGAKTAVTDSDKLSSIVLTWLTLAMRAAVVLPPPAEKAKAKRRKVLPPPATVHEFPKTTH